MVACLCVALVSFAAAPARALDAAIERGRALLAAGDVAGALGVVGEVEARSDLPAGDLLPLLALRGTAEAMSEDALALARTARAIVELGPAWHAPEGAPEAFRAALDEARIAQPEPPELDVDVYPADGALRIVIECDDDVDLVRGTRLAWRVGGERAWHRSEAREERVAGLAGTPVEYYVEALGPGGVVVAREGSARIPVRASVPGSDADATGGLGTMTPTSDDGKTIWFIAGGVTIAAILAVVALVALGRTSDRTDLGVPVVEWP
jgi:hypothetical protein